MPRTASSSNGLTLAQLEKMMQSRRAEVTRLTRQRAKLQKKLDALDAQIASVSGGAGDGRSTRGGGGGGGRRVRNESSLQDVIHQVLSKAGEPLSVGDIAAKVQSSGYRSNSGNFRGIVNQTLIKDKRFTSAGRGVYQLKK
jgi:septal ring factor EnvC (AmiA/AmiB activator)